MATLDQLLLGAQGGGEEGQFMKGLFRAMVQGTRASNAIPAGTEKGAVADASGSDFAFHAAVNPAFAGKASDAGAAVLGLIDKIVRHLDTNGAAEDSGDGEGLLGALEEAVDPSAFESLAELLEDLLDTVDAHLSRPKGPATEAASGDGGGGMDVGRLRRAATGAAAAARGYRAMLSEVVEMVKPQAAFADLIDNRRGTCFVPRLFGRDVGVGGGGMEVDGEGGAVSTTESPHPYETEVRNFAYLPWQLAAPTAEEVTAAVPLPLAEAPPLGVVDTAGALAAMVAQIQEDLAAEPEGRMALAVDLEHHQVRSFQGLTCLMQLSTRRHDWVVDTLALRREVGPALAELFADHRVVKVLHGAESDVKWLQRDFSLYIVNLFDTFLATKQLRPPPGAFSLAHLLQRYCQVQADKKYQLADWRVRPLPPEMLKYAREDTHYLLYVHDCLKRDVAQGCGGSVGETRAALERALDGGRELCLLRYRKEVFDPDGYLRLLLGGPARLMQTKPPSEESMAVAKALYDWRDRFAREQDESPAYVCPERLLLRIATALPRDFDALQACARPLPPLLTAQAEAILAVVARAAASGKGSTAGEKERESSSYTFATFPPVSLPPATARHLNLQPSPTAPLPSGPASIPPPTDQQQLPLSTSTSPVLPTEDLYIAAGWTAPLAPPRHGAAATTTAAAPPDTVLPGRGNAGLEAHRALRHSLDLSGGPEADHGAAAAAAAAAMVYGGGGGAVEGGAPSILGGEVGEMQLHYATAIDPLAAARVLLRREQGLPPVNDAVVEFDDDVSDQEAGQGEEKEGDEEGGESELPRSMADIYRISNRNRRRNKEKKKATGGGAAGCCGHGVGAMEEDGVGGVGAGAGAGAVSAPLDPDIAQYFAGGAGAGAGAGQGPLGGPGGRRRAPRGGQQDADDTVRFMASIGWIAPGADGVGTHAPEQPPLMQGNTLAPAPSGPPPPVLMQQQQQGQGQRVGLSPEEVQQMMLLAAGGSVEAQAALLQQWQRQQQQQQQRQRQPPPPSQQQQGQGQGQQRPGHGGMHGASIVGMPPLPPHLAQAHHHQLPPPPPPPQQHQQQGQHNPYMSGPQGRGAGGGGRFGGMGPGPNGKRGGGGVGGGVRPMMQGRMGGGPPGPHHHPHQAGRFGGNGAPYGNGPMGGGMPPPTPQQQQGFAPPPHHQQHQQHHMPEPPRGAPRHVPPHHHPQHARGPPPPGGRGGGEGGGYDYGSLPPNVVAAMGMGGMLSAAPGVGEEQGGRPPPPQGGRGKYGGRPERPPDVYHMPQQQWRAPGGGGGYH